MKVLTPYERKLVAHTFKRAKAIFEQGRCTYICTALGWTVRRAYPEDSEEYRAYKLAQEVVMQRLQGHKQLESWLQSQGFFIPTKPGPELEQKLHNHRMQWLDMLIAEFEGEKS